jgi:hypothetical protein
MLPFGIIGVVTQYIPTPTLGSHWQIGLNPAWLHLVTHKHMKRNETQEGPPWPPRQKDGESDPTPWPLGGISPRTALHGEEEMSVEKWRQPFDMFFVHEQKMSLESLLQQSSDQRANCGTQGLLQFCNTHAS